VCGIRRLQGSRNDRQMAMKGRVHFLVVGVPGVCFVIAGALNAEYLAVALGGILVLGSVYGLSRGKVPMLGNNDQKRQRLSFLLAGIIGVSFAITGFVGHRYWLAAAGLVLFIGALLRFYGTVHSDAR
jgi:hypothetical protein